MTPTSASRSSCTSSPIKAMEEVINHKIDLFDAADKVKYYTL
jgi:hypothetical protein